MNEKGLEEITLKVLDNPGGVCSSDFITAYNIVYSHCTTPVDSKDIRGEVIYELLKSSFEIYCKSLKVITSLRNFYEMSIHCRKSYDLLEEMFCYLERFYIKINIERQNHEVTDIKTLYYSCLYRFFFRNHFSQIVEFIIDEVKFARTSRKYNLEILRQAVQFFKKLLYFADESKKYEKFLDEYFNSFSQSVKDDDDVKVMHKKIDKEIIIGTKVFLFTENGSFFNIVQVLRPKAEEVFKLLFEKARNLKKINNLVKVITLLNRSNGYRFIDEYIEIFTEKVNSVETISDILILYTEIKVQLKECILSTDKVFNVLDELVRKKLVEFNEHSIFIPKKVNDLIYLIHETNIFDIIVHDEKLLANICSFDKYSYEVCSSKTNSKSKKYDRHYVLSCVYESIYSLFKFVSLSYMKDAIIEALCIELQKRLISRNTDSVIEKSIFKKLEEILKSPPISKIRKPISDYYSGCIRYEFNINYQENPLKLFVNYLTKGFWNLKKSEIELPNFLKEIQDSIFKKKLIKNKKAVIFPVYEASCILFEFCGYEFNISTDMFCVLYDISQNTPLVKIRNKYQSLDLEKILSLFVQFNLIKYENEEYYLNNDFSLEDYEKAKSCAKCNLSREAREGVIDLFNFDILTDKEEILEDKNKLMLSSAVEAYIVRKLKRDKNVMEIDLIDDVVKVFIIDSGKADNIIRRLVSKEFIKIIGNMVSYLP